MRNLKGGTPLFAQVAGCEITLCLRQDCVRGLVPAAKVKLCIASGSETRKAVLNQGGTAVLCLSVVL